MNFNESLIIADLCHCLEDYFAKQTGVFNLAPLEQTGEMKRRMGMFVAECRI